MLDSMRTMILLAAFAFSCSGRDGTSTANRTNTAERPYHSVSNLLAHRAKKWIVVVLDAADYTVGEKSPQFQVGELRAADLPLRASSPWKCRIDHAYTMTLAESGGVTRSLACSSDDWRTRVEVAAGYCATDGCKMDEEDAVLTLQASPPFRSFDLIFGSRARIAEAEYPELP